MKNQKSILFVLPVSTQPRYAKRIRSYQKEGAEITVASFEREYFSKNTLPANINYISLGGIASGNYFRRIPHILKVLKKLITLSKDKSAVFMFSADIFIFLCPFLAREKVWYEIGDIREFSRNYLFNSVYEYIYGRTLRRVDTVFVTSVGFKNYIITQYGISQEKVHVIENKLQRGEFTYQPLRGFQQLSKSDFTVGIIGLLRYRNILRFLEAYKRSSAKFFIAIYGDGPLRGEIESYVDNNKIKFYGQFKYPNDLETIYKSIDLSFTMYNSEDQNVKLALPNKLYESMCFKKPIVVSKGTYLAERVQEERIGFSWDQNDMAGLIAYLESETFLDDYNSLEGNFNNIDESQYLI